MGWSSSFKWISSGYAHHLCMPESLRDTVSQDLVLFFLLWPDLVMTHCSSLVCRGRWCCEVCFILPLRQWMYVRIFSVTSGSMSGQPLEKIRSAFATFRAFVVMLMRLWCRFSDFNASQWRRRWRRRRVSWVCGHREDDLWHLMMLCLMMRKLVDLFAISPFKNLIASQSVVELSIIQSLRVGCLVGICVEATEFEIFRLMGLHS